MSFLDCLVQQINERRVPENLKNDIVEIFNDSKRAFEQQGKSAAESDALATDFVLKFAEEAKGGTQIAIRQAITNNDIRTYFDKYKGDTKSAAAQYAQDTIAREQTIFADGMTFLNSEFERIKEKMWSNKSTKSDASSAIYKMGEGDLSDPLSKGFKMYVDYYLDRYRAAGGVLAEAKKNYTPFQFRKDDVLAFVKDVPEAERPQAFAAKVMENLDREISFKDLPDEDVFSILIDSYKNIISDNAWEEFNETALAKLSPRKRQAYYARRNQTKFLYWKDEGAHREMMNVFGGGEDGMFGAMLRYGQNMAKDIAVMEKFGPNPEEGIGFFRRELLRRGGSRGDADWHAEKVKWLARLKYAEGEDTTLAKIGWAARSYTRVRLMGSAIISWLGDGVFAANAAKVNGSAPVKSMLAVYKNFLSVAKDDLELIKSTGQTLDFMNSMLGVENRFHGTISANSLLKGLNDLTFKRTGFARSVRASKIGPQIEAMRTMAREGSKSWADVDPTLKQQLSLLGMTEDMWEQVIRKHKPSVDQDFGFSAFDYSAMRVNEKLPLKLRNDAATIISDWVNTVRNMASNENNLTARFLSSGAFFSDALGGGRAGSVGTEIAAQAFMLKSFTVSQMNFHLMPMLRDIKSQGASALAPLATMAAATTVTGSIVYMLQELSKGRTPPTFFDKNGDLKWETIKIGAQRGGFFGLYGDAAFEMGTRFGRKPSDALFEFPIRGLYDDVHKMSTKLLDVGFGDDKKKDFMKFNAMASSFLLNYLGSSMWFLRPVMINDVRDGFNHLLDPDYNEKIKREKKRLEQDGQKYWYKPGTLRRALSE